MHWAVHLSNVLHCTTPLYNQLISNAVYCTVELHSTEYCTLYPVHCTLYTVHCTLYTVHCIQFTLHCTLQNGNCKLYTIHCTLYTVHSTLSKLDYLFDFFMIQFFHGDTYLSLEFKRLSVFGIFNFTFFQQAFWILFWYICLSALVLHFVITVKLLITAFFLVLF